MRKITLIHPLAVLFLNIQYWLFLKYHRSEIRIGWLGLCYSFHCSAPWLSLGPNILGPGFISSLAWLVGAWWDCTPPGKGRAGSRCLSQPGSLIQPLGQNEIIHEGIGKKDLSPAVHNSGQKMSCLKTCSSDQNLWNLPPKHRFVSCSCFGLHAS